MASKRRIRRKACGSKHKFASEYDALRQALAVKRRTGTQAFVGAYKCTFCNCWHWGHKYKNIVTNLEGSSSVK